MAAAIRPPPTSHDEKQRDDDRQAGHDGRSICPSASGTTIGASAFDIASALGTVTIGRSTTTIAAAQQECRQRHQPPGGPARS